MTNSVDAKHTTFLLLDVTPFSQMLDKNFLNQHIKKIKACKMLAFLVNQFPWCQSVFSSITVGNPWRSLTIDTHSRPGRYGQKLIWSKWPKPVSEGLPSKPREHMEHIGTCYPSRFWFCPGTRWHQYCLWKPWRKAHGTSFIIKEHLQCNRINFLHRVLPRSRLDTQRTSSWPCNFNFFIEGFFLAKALLEGSSQLIGGSFFEMVWHWHSKLEKIENAIYTFYKTSERPR